MNQNKTEKKNSNIIILIAILLVTALFISGFVGALSLGVITIGKEKTIVKYNSNAAPVTATITIDYGDDTILSKEITSKNNTVYGFLMELGNIEGFNVKATYYGQFDSLFVDSISSYEGGTDNKYWIYYVNDESGYVGADKQLVNNGDVILWRFEESLY